MNSNRQCRMKPTAAGRSGFGMLTAIGITMLVALLSTVTYTVASHQIQSARRIREFLKAKVIAEAGANARYNAIKHRFADFSLHDWQTFGDGSYQTELIQHDTEHNQARLISVGRCGQSEAHIELLLRNYQRFFTNDHPVLQNAITTFSPLVIKGTVSVFNGGNIASKVSVEVTSNAARIDGGANAPVVIDKHDAISGAICEDPAMCDYQWNDFLRLSDYLDHAVLYDRSVSLESYPPNTILYVPGDITINPSTPLQLCIIATGKISVSGSAVLKQPGTYPTLVSEMGNIEFSAGANVEGLIAAMGVSSTIKSAGGGNTPININGSIILGGTFDGSGTWSINFKKVALTPPGEDNTLIMAWQ